MFFDRKRYLWMGITCWVMLTRFSTHGRGLTHGYKFSTSSRYDQEPGLVAINPLVENLFTTHWFPQLYLTLRFSGKISIQIQSTLRICGTSGLRVKIIIVNVYIISNNRGRPAKSQDCCILVHLNAFKLYLIIILFTQNY